MKQRTFYPAILVVCLSALVIYGCGSDEKEPEKPTVAPSTTEESTLSTEELLGSWDITSINNQAPDVFVDEVFNGEEPDLEDRPKTSIGSFYAVFEENQTWHLNLEMQMSDFPEDPNKDDPVNAARIEMTGKWSGQYSAEGSELTLTINDTDVIITTNPTDLFETLFEVSEMSAQQEMTGKFASQVLLPFAKTIVTPEGDKLELQSNVTPNAWMILEKQ